MYLYGLKWFLAFFRRFSDYFQTQTITQSIKVTFDCFHRLRCFIVAWIVLLLRTTLVHLAMLQNYVEEKFYLKLENNTLTNLSK